MNSPFDVSFCIPTYNFAKFIGETLDSIIRQADERVQIVIVDGGSTDGTAEIVREKSRDFPNIKFIQRSQRCGVDLDILESVAQADGDFCWLFSSDDILAPGALSFVREQTPDDWDVFLTNIALCDQHMHRLCRHSTVDVKTTTTFDWNVPAERARYSAKAATTTAFFSFISGIVVRRASWNSVERQSAFIGSCWIIAAQLFALAQKRLVIRYFPGELVLKRGDNDSFMAGGLVKRVALSIDGFRRVAEHYFGAGSPLARQVSRVLKNEFTFIYLLFHKVEVEDWNDPVRLSEYLALIRRNYADGLPLDFLRRSALLAPTSIQRALLAAYRHLKPARRVARIVLQFTQHTWSQIHDLLRTELRRRPAQPAVPGESQGILH
ncbi:MAG TPA: glycosyltransferase family 2 protein [Planctomycetaceae bacterium]|jgi:abequosyltransferase